MTDRKYLHMTRRPQARMIEIKQGFVMPAHAGIQTSIPTAKTQNLVSCVRGMTE
jgi:hypothetical protein